MEPDGGCRQDLPEKADMEGAAFQGGRRPLGFCSSTAETGRVYIRR